MNTRNLTRCCATVVTAAVLIVISCVIAVGQSISKPPKGFRVDYDKFKDRTDVSYLSTDYKGLLQSWFSFTYDGQNLQKNVETFYVTFLGTGRCYGFCFKQPTLILLIDGDRHAISNNQLADIVRFPLPRSIVEKIANAKIVEFQVGTYEEVWKPKAIEKWRQLLGLGTLN
jgi:hypothetical protein